MARVIKWDLEIDWTLNGTYVNESARLQSATATVRLAAPESSITSPRGTSDQCTLTLDNHDGRYSPLNTSSPLYSALAYGGAYHAPMYLSVSVDNGSTYSRVFTGVIKIPIETPPYPGAASTVQVDCRSRDETLLNKRMSTPLATFQTMHNGGYTEAQIITTFLQQAGLSSGDYAIDSGLFVIPWAWLDDESPIGDIWSLAAACGGRFYCGQEGVYRYENMTHWLMAPHTTSQETITEGGYGQMQGPAYNDRELYSGVTAIASPRDQLERGVLWSATSTQVVAPGSSKQITAKLRQPAYQIDNIAYTAVSGGGRNMSSAIGISATYYAQRVEMTISNSDANYAAELYALEIQGVSVNGGPTIEETRSSSKSFWSNPLRPGRTYLLRDNVYLQTGAQAGALAEFLRDRYQTPRITWTLRNVPGSPFRRLGDRITLANTPAMSANRDGFITALTWRLSSRGFNQDIEVLDASGLYPYGNPGDDGYFIIGSNSLGSGSGSGHAHIFY